MQGLNINLISWIVFFRRAEYVRGTLNQPRLPINDLVGMKVKLLDRALSPLSMATATLALHAVAWFLRGSLLISFPRLSHNMLRENKTVTHPFV